MNAYDFDQTIYDGDCTAHFLLSCMRRPRVALHVLGLIPIALRFALGKATKTAFKQRLFGFLRFLPDVDAEVARFWDGHIGRIKPFYRQQKRADDLILSASPEFLLRPALDRLGVDGLIASKVDKRTGVYDGLNCDGEQKPIRLRAERPDAAIDSFYSDSLSDAPMARIAKSAYLVKGDAILPWPKA